MRCRQPSLRNSSKHVPKSQDYSGNTIPRLPDHSLPRGLRSELDAIAPAAGSGMGAVTARRFRDEGADVVLTGRTREKLTKVVSQFDQERSLIHVSDMTKPDRRATDSARQY
jgi:hypothetical protein